MPRQFLNAVQAAHAAPWHEEAPCRDFDDYCLWHAQRIRSLKQRRAVLTSFKKEDVTTKNDDKIEYQSDNGEMVYLSKESLEACKKDCKEAPEFKGGGGTAAGVTPDRAQSGVADEGEDTLIAQCIKRCNEEFPFCFPACSTVVVRDQGRIPLSKLRTGDMVLVMRSSGSASDQEVVFEPVITWLHYEPDAEIPVVKVRHSLGEVSLTPDHMLFVRRPGDSCVGSIASQEVCVGDRVLAPWIDGGLAEPEVIEVSQLRASGAYCPLTPSGTLLVDSTVASCYIVPRDLISNPLYGKLIRAWNGVAGRDNLHELAHMMLLPVRLRHRVQAAAEAVASMTLQRKDEKVEDRDAEPSDKLVETIHPYGFFLYVLAKSFVV